MNPVRESVQEVVDDAEYVTIDDEAVSSLAAEYAEKRFEVPYWNEEDTAPVFPGEDWSDEERMQYFFVGNVLNSHFTDIEVDEEGNAAKTGAYKVDYAGNPWGMPFKGAFGMWAALKRGVEEGYDMLDAEYLASIGKEDLQEIFRPADNGVEMPLLYEDAVPSEVREKGVVSKQEMLHAAGELLEPYDGSFANMVDCADDRAFGEDGIVPRLADSPAYADVWPVGDSEVRFDKRSQLLVTMLHGAFQDQEDTYNIQDLDELTVFADYRLPQYLEEKGALDYDETLVDSIEEGEEIPAGSQKEIEIRAATVQAGEELLEQTNKLRQELGNTPIGIPELDYQLWNSGRETDTERSHHITRTTAY